jgi:hypothetical protein
MSFFNGDTSVSEQILVSNSASEIVVDKTDDTDPQAVTYKPLIYLYISVSGSDQTHYVYLSTTGAIQGCVCRVFFKKESSSKKIVIKSNSTLSQDEDVNPPATTTGGKFYTFVYKPTSGSESKWFLQS